MTEKIMITQEQADAVKEALSDSGKAEILNAHIKVGWGLYECLNVLSVVDMARILYEPNSYEIEPEYKVGDWVAHLNGSNIYAKGNAKVVEVHSLEKCCEGFDYVRHGVNGEWGTPVNLIRHATPEEIKAEKERRLWKKIGRDPNQFKLGDAYVHKNGWVLLIDKDERIPIIKKQYDAGELKGIYPAESFISFEEGDSD